MYWIAIISLFLHFAISSYEEKKFIVVVPSYNNEQWVERNLTSILTQDYSNFHVIYINDCSTDATLERVIETIEKHNAQDKATLVSNPSRRGAMANFYNAIHLCPDEAIIVNVDGDDWLAHNQVLKYLNDVYSDQNIWMTFGQFLFDRYNTIGFCQPFSDDIIRTNRFRQSPGKLPISHLRTYYSWIFKQVKLKDFLYQGDFYPMTCDKAIMAPIVEMCGWRHKCIQKVLYIYNEFNPINDHQIDKSLQHFLCDYILNREPYQPLQTSVSIAKQCDKKSINKIFLTQSMKAYQLLDQIYSCESDYIFIDSSNSNISDQDIQKALYCLEATGALVAHFNIADNLRESKSTCVDLSLGALAWQPIYARKAFQYPLCGTTFLIRTQYLRDLLEFNLNKDIGTISFLDSEDIYLAMEQK